MSTISNLITEYNTSKKQLEAKVKAEFSKLFTNFFDKYPDAKLFRFTAFTPYFNDGEPCVYGVNDLELVVDGVELNNEDFDEDDYGYGENGLSVCSWNSIPWPSEEMKADFVTLEKDFRAIPEEILSGVFEEGLFVITREGIDIRAYDHD